MRHSWYTADVGNLLGPEHPLSKRLYIVARPMGGCNYWERDELAVILCDLVGESLDWRRAFRAGLLLGCAGEMLQLAPWFARTMTEVKG